MNKQLPLRKHPRLDQFDYSTPGAYFVTICTHNRKCLLSRIVPHGFDPAEIQYTVLGRIALNQLLLLENRYPSLKIDKFVIMPNHIHVIFFLEQPENVGRQPSVTDIVCAYKSLTTRACKGLYTLDKLFQSSFYDHVIRGQADYDEIAEYIVNNPKKWELDKLYSCEMDM